MRGTVLTNGKLFQDISRDMKRLLSLKKFTEPFDLTSLFFSSNNYGKINTAMQAFGLQL